MSKLPFLIFLTVRGDWSVADFFFNRKQRQFISPSLFKWFQYNKSREICCFFFSIRFWEIPFLFFVLPYVLFVLSQALCFTTHHGIQILLDFTQGKNLFALQRKGYIDQYTLIEIKISNPCEISRFSQAKTKFLKVKSYFFLHNWHYTAFQHL